MQDAPWIREAENDGDYDEETETKYRSRQFQESIAEDLARAVELMDQVTDILSGQPEDTDWDDDINGLYDAGIDLQGQIERMKETIERWDA